MRCWHPGADAAGGSVQRDQLRRAEVFGPHDPGAQRGRIVQHDMLRPDASNQRVRQRARPGYDCAPDREPAGRPRRLQQVHGWATKKPGDKQRGRAVIHVLRRADLLDHAVVHDRNLVRKRHRLLLVMRHIDRGRS